MCYPLKGNNVTKYDIITVIYQYLLVGAGEGEKAFSKRSLTHHDHMWHIKAHCQSL